MARLYITGYRYTALDDYGRPTMAPKAPPVLEAYLEITRDSLHTDPFPDYTKFIVVKAEAECALAFGKAGDEVPVAHHDFHLVEAGERLMYGVEPGERLAVTEV